MCYLDFLKVDLLINGTIVKFDFFSLYNM